MIVGCTVGELGQRMGSAEFSAWQAFLAEEELGPTAQQHQWASLMAALYNGPLARKNKTLWQAGEFLPRPWAAPARPAAAKPASGADARRHVAQQRRAKAEAAALRKAKR